MNIQIPWFPCAVATLKEEWTSSEGNYFHEVLFSIEEHWAVHFDRDLNTLTVSGNSSKWFHSLENSSKRDFTVRLSVAMTQLIAHLQEEFYTFIASSECGERNMLPFSWCSETTCQINLFFGIHWSIITIIYQRHNDPKQNWFSPFQLKLLLVDLSNLMPFTTKELS